MKLIHRLTYFGGGFLIGMVLLFFFLGGKRASCDYGPNARTLKNIRSKELVVDSSSVMVLSQMSMDTSDVGQVLRTGDVDFSKSQTRLDSCRVYWISGNSGEQLLQFEVENCSEEARVFNLQVIRPD